MRRLRQGKRLPATTRADNRMYHADTSTEIEVLRLVRDKGNLAPGVVDKILNDNAVALYGL